MRVGQACEEQREGGLGTFDGGDNDCRFDDEDDEDFISPERVFTAVVALDTYAAHINNIYLNI